MVEQIDKVDVAIEIGGLVAELHHYSAQLQILCLGDIGHQADDSKRLLFRLGKGGRFIHRRVP